MKKSTQELLSILNQSKDIKHYINEQQEHFTTGSLSDLLNRFTVDKAVSVSECIRRSGLDRTYCYQIFSGTRKPSRDKLLAICFALGLHADEVQGLLKATGYAALYPRLQRDSIILFALEHHYPLIQLNEVLLDMEFDLIE